MEANYEGSQNQRQDNDLDDEQKLNNIAPLPPVPKNSLFGFMGKSILPNDKNTKNKQNKNKSKKQNIKGNQALVYAVKTENIDLNFEQEIVEKLAELTEPVANSKFYHFNEVDNDAFLKHQLSQEEYNKISNKIKVVEKEEKNIMERQKIEEKYGKEKDAMLEARFNLIESYF